jgi:cell division protein FtsW
MSAMNKKITAFLDNVCMYIRCKAVHKDIRDELTHHIEDLKAEYLRQGQDDEKALDMAITAMGDCEEIGSRLNKQHKPKTEWSLIGLGSMIVVIGGIIMFASSKFETAQTVSFERYLLFALIGIGVMIGFYFFDYTRLKKLALPMYLIAFSLLIFTLFSSTEVQGRKFLALGGVLISSDYLTILFLIAFSGFMAKRRGKGGIAIVELLVLAFVSVIPIIMLPYLSQAVVLLIGYAVLIIAAVIKNYFDGNRKKQLLYLSGMGVMVIFLAVYDILSNPYRFDRITAFLSSSGFIYDRVDKWLAASNWFGKTPATVSGYGLGSGMPEVTTGYVLVNVIATLGWMVGIALVLIISLFIIRMFMTTKKIKNDYGFYLSLAASTALSVQFIINILSNFNLSPILGMNMPFVSYGGKGYVVNMAFVGIILSVWRRNDLVGSTTKIPVSNSRRFIKFEDGKLIISFK